jgi:predicted dehydrogenase
MRFALLGIHPDGLAMAAALVASGRHELASYTDPVGDDWLRHYGAAARRVADAEEVLADPAVELVIVAGKPDVRPLQLRRALQSERHVLCVHPPDPTAEVAYEAGMIQQDTRCVLLPLLYEAPHPAVRHLAALLRPADASPVGALRLLQVERGAALSGDKPSLPGWDLLRALGGEVAELTGYAEREAVEPGVPVLVAGRFERGGMFQVTLLPGAEEGLRVTAVGEHGRAELDFPVGWNGPAFLDWRDDAGELQEESWDVWDPWPALVDRFEAAVSGAPGAPTWQDAVRALELDDAARRSVEKRRGSLLEYQEATEAVGFKGTMTLVGCGLVWLILLALFASVWVPQLGWIIVPLIVAFLALQALRYVLPKPVPPPAARTSGAAAVSSPDRCEIAAPVPGPPPRAVQSKE